MSQESSSINSDIANNVVVERVISKTDIEKIVRASTNYKIFTIDSARIYPASEKKLGFLCDHFKLKLIVTAQQETNTLQYFVKCRPIENEEKASFLNENNLYEKEVKIYGIMEKLCSYLGTAPWFPVRYLSTHSALAMEDLSLKGYASHNPRDPFTKEHCFVALRSLAKQQASSIIYEEKRSQELGIKHRLEDEHRNDFDRGIFVMSGYYETGMHSMLTVAAKYSKYASDESKINIIKSKWIDLWTDNLKLGVTPVDGRSVLSQRDLWGRNLMYRYEDNIPRDCLIIDYQTAGCLPVAADIMSLIYVNTNRETRIQWESELFKYFYRQLGENLRRHNIDVNNFISEREYLKLIDKYKLWGNVHAIVEHHMIYLNENCMENILNNSDTFGRVMNTVEGRVELVINELERDHYYRKMVLDSIEEFIDTFILTD